MATAPKVTDKPDTMEWEGETVTKLAGTRLVDKATLVDIPFAITGIKLAETKPDEDTGEIIVYMVIEANLGRTKGKVFFQDSSTGVKRELTEIASKFLGDKFNGEIDVWYDLPGYFCPEGLRASPYKKKVNGRQIDAVTYYLTYASEGRP